MQSQISGQVLGTFFQKLKTAVEQELQLGQIKASVRNRFEESHINEIHIELELLGQLRLLVTINHLFPRKEAPVVYCLSNLESPLVDGESKVVFYQQIIQWKDYPKLIYLIKALEKYWRQNPPQPNKERREME
jgi:hypothetical protein